MAGILNILFILIVYGLIGVKSQNNTCTQINYNQCVKDLAPLLHAAETFYIKYTVGRMGELCSIYQSTKVCIQQFEHRCVPEVQTAIQSTHAYFEYICDNTFSVFVKYRDCLVKPELEARAHGCNSTFFQSITTRGTGSPCGHQRDYVDCLSAEVKSICGQEAADWQLGLDKAVLQPLLTARGCSLDVDRRSYCTKNNMDKCFSPLVKHPIHDGSHIVPTHTVENIVAICKSYTEVRPCIDLFIDECHPHDQRYFRSLHDSYKYVCDDNLQEYFKHRDCLATPKLHSEGRLCENSFYMGFKSRHYYEGTAQYQHARLCQHANTLVDCIEHLVESFCGRDAAAWQRGLDVAVYSPLLEYIECEIKTAASHISLQTIIAITVSVAVVIIMMLVALILICRCIKKKRKDSNSHVRMNEEQMGQSPAPASPRVVYTVPSPVSAQEQGAMAALPPDLLPPEYTEKPQFGENVLLAAAIAYQTSGDDIKVPLPPDDDAGYVSPMDMSNTRDSICQPPEYEDADLGQGSR